MNVSHVSQPDRSLRLCNPPPIARSVGQYVRAVHRGDVLATFRSIDLALAAIPPKAWPIGVVLVDAKDIVRAELQPWVNGRVAWLMAFGKSGKEGVST